MVKLEELKDNEWELILYFLYSELQINQDILDNFRCCDFDEEELKSIKERQKILKSCVRKLEKMKGKVLYTYD